MNFILILLISIILSTFAYSDFQYFPAVVYGNSTIKKQQRNITNCLRKMLTRILLTSFLYIYISVDSINPIRFIINASLSSDIDHIDYGDHDRERNCIRS